MGLYDQPREEQERAIAFDLVSRGEVQLHRPVKVVPQLADGVEGTTEAASRLAEFMVQ